MLIDPAPGQGTPSTADSKASRRWLIYPWYVVVILMLAQVVSFIDRQVITLLVQLIRADLAINDTGMSLLMGLAFVIFYVTMGVPIARLSDRYSRRTIIAIAMPFVAITPLMPTADLAIPMLGIAVFTLSLQQALSPVAIQLFTPNQMRAQVVAVFFVISTFSAIAFGATSVALVTDYLFRDENDLRYSLAIVCAITMSLAATSLALGIKPYRASLERAAA